MNEFRGYDSPFTLKRPEPERSGKITDFHPITVLVFSKIFKNRKKFVEYSSFSRYRALNNVIPADLFGRIKTIEYSTKEEDKKLYLMKFAFFVLILHHNLQAQGKPIKYPDPSRFENLISAFEKEEKSKWPPRNAIVCSGSSGMSQWHHLLYHDLAPLTIIPRGFAGSNFNDQLYFADRIYMPYQPRAIILYQGENDISLGASPDEVLIKFRDLVQKVRQKLPQVRFYFISIKPTPSRWELWPKMEEANRLIEKECAEIDFLFFIDVASLMLDQERKPYSTIFDEDGLNLNSKGYEIWRESVRGVIIEAEWPYE